jgi:hypothetical protein
MRSIAVFLAAAATLLAGCLPVTTRVPAGSTVGFKADPALLGTWRAVSSDQDAPAYIHILGNDDGTMTAIVITPPDRENPGDWSTYKLRAATLGANHIVNAQESIANGRPSEGPLAQQHVLLVYRVEAPGKIGLYRMDDQAAAAGIRTGDIAGEIEPGENGDVRITAPEPALDRFMGTPRAANLFTKLLVTLVRAN